MKEIPNKVQRLYISPNQEAQIKIVKITSKCFKGAITEVSGRTNLAYR